MEQNGRIHLFDEIRGFAVLCMIFHHALLTIAEVFWSQLFMDAFNFLCIFQPIVWFMFFGGAGVSSRLSRNNLKRGLRLLGIALVITAFTFAYFNGRATIKFGALHFLSVAMIIYHFISPVFKKINAKVGIAVCAVLFIFTYGIYNGYVGIFDFVKIRLPYELYSTKFLFWLGFPQRVFMSADYFPLIPYIFLFFIGCFLGGYVVAGRLPKRAYESKFPFLSFFGKNALIMYIIHQPIIYALCYFIRWIVW